MRTSIRICIERIYGEEYVEIKEYGVSGKLVNKLRISPDQAVDISLEILCGLPWTKAGTDLIRASSLYPEFTKFFDLVCAKNQSE